MNELGACVQESIRGGISQLVANANAWKKFKLLWRMQRVTDTHTAHDCVISISVDPTYIHVYGSIYVYTYVYVCIVNAG